MYLLAIRGCGGVRFSIAAAAKKTRRGVYLDAYGLELRFLVRGCSILIRGYDFKGECSRVFRRRVGVTSRQQSSESTRIDRRSGWCPAI